MVEVVEGIVLVALVSFLVDDTYLSVVELQLVLVVDKSHVVGLVVVEVLVGDDVYVLFVGEDDIVEHLKGSLGELYESVCVSLDFLRLFLADGFADSSGDSHERVGRLSTDDRLYFLSLGTGLQNGGSELESDVGDDTENVPLRCRCCRSADEVGCCQCVEVCDVAVYEVRVVEGVPDVERRLGGLRVVASVDGLGSREVVSTGADTAKPCGDLCELGNPPADAESLESPDLGDLPVCVFHISAVVEEDLDLSMSLETGDGVNGHSVAGDLLFLIPNDRCCHLSSSFKRSSPQRQTC